MQTIYTSPKPCSLAEQETSSVYFELHILADPFLAPPLVLTWVGLEKHAGSSAHASSQAEFTFILALGCADQFNSLSCGIWDRHLYNDCYDTMELACIWKNKERSWGTS